MSNNFSQDIGYKIHKAVFVMDKIADSSLQQNLDLSLSQFLLLMAIVNKPNVSQIEIADFLEQSQAAVSRQIDVLKNKNIIGSKINEANRRENVLFPTAEGQRVFKEANKILDEKFNELYRVMNQKEKEDFENSLDKILFSVCGKNKDWSN